MVAGKLEDTRISEDMRDPSELILVGTSHMDGGGVDRLNDAPEFGGVEKEGVLVGNAEGGVLVGGVLWFKEIEEEDKAVGVEAQEVPKSVCVGTETIMVTNNVVSIGTGTVTTRPATTRINGF